MRCRPGIEILLVIVLAFWAALPIDAWISLLALILLAVSVSRPRWRQRSWRRWAFNFGAVISALLCVVCVAGWVRSYSVSEQWLFEPLPARPEAGWAFPMVAQRWVSSERGELIWQERQTPASGPISFAPLPAGYQRQALFDYRVYVGGPGIGQRELRWPGIGFFSSSPTVMSQPGLAQAAMASGWLYPGVRALVVSWWLLVAISAILPVLWVYFDVSWRRRVRKDGAADGVKCSACGYDIRASPGRCPECGYSAEMATPAHQT